MLASGSEFVPLPGTQRGSPLNNLLSFSSSLLLSLFLSLSLPLPPSLSLFLCHSLSLKGPLITEIPGLQLDGNICFPEQILKLQGSLLSPGWGRRTTEGKRKGHTLGTGCIHRENTVQAAVRDLGQVLSCLFLAERPKSSGQRLSGQRGSQLGTG